MNKLQQINQSEVLVVDENFFIEFWEESWTYIKTVVDVLREPVLILDEHCHVLAGNEAYYAFFQARREDTEGKSIYLINDGIWNIPALQKLLKSIIPKHTFFNGFEVTREFPTLGKRTIILNARHIHTSKSTTKKHFPPIIMLAMEDVSEILTIANRLASYTNELEKTLAHRTKLLEHKVSIVEEQITRLKK